MFHLVSCAGSVYIGGERIRGPRAGARCGTRNGCPGTAGSPLVLPSDLRTELISEKMHGILLVMQRPGHRRAVQLIIRPCSWSVLSQVAEAIAQVEAEEKAAAVKNAIAEVRDH